MICLKTTALFSTPEMIRLIVRFQYGTAPSTLRIMKVRYLLREPMMDMMMSARNTTIRSCMKIFPKVKMPSENKYSLL